MKLDLEMMGNRFRRARKAVNLSQEELFERMDYSKNYISLIERGQSKPTVEFLMKACNVLGGTPDYYLIGIKNENTDRIEELLKSLSISEQEKVIYLLEQYILKFH